MLNDPVLAEALDALPVDSVHDVLAAAVRVKRIGRRVFEKNATPAEIARDLWKAHVNLGHCSNDALIRALRAAGAPDEAIRQARELQCDECDKHKQPKINNHVPFERIGLDVKELRSWRAGQTEKFLNIVDRCSELLTMTRVPNASGETLRQAYRTMWRRHYDVPTIAVSDSARAIQRGVFAKMFERE